MLVSDVRRDRERFLAELGDAVAAAPVGRSATVEATLRDALVSAAVHPHLADLYVVKVLEAVPGLGKVASRRILDARGVAHRHAVADLTAESIDAVAGDAATLLSADENGRGESQ